MIDALSDGRVTICAVVSALFTVTLLLQGAAPGVEFIHDDYRRALSEARRLQRPLFIDAWAPWCHSCLSMQAYVFTDPALKPFANQFVWVSLDTERAENASFLAHFPIEAWPTLLVLDPQTLEPRARWLGSLSAPELTARLQDLLNAAAKPPSSEDPAEKALREAIAEDGNGQRAEAVTTLRKALEHTTAGPQRAQLVEMLVDLLHTYDQRDCAARGIQEAPQIPSGVQQANVLSSGMRCALALHNGDTTLLRKGEAELEAILAEKSSPLLADDQSDLYSLWVESRRARGDVAGLQAIAQRWVALLEHAAAAAPDAMGRAVFDAHRVLAYEAAGTPERAVPMLEQREQELPRDYNASERLAEVLVKLGGRSREAVFAANKARSRVYGPRTVRVLLTQAEAYREAGNTSGAREILKEAEHLIARLPAEQRRPDQWQQLDAARRRLGR